MKFMNITRRVFIPCALSAILWVSLSADQASSKGPTSASRTGSETRTAIPKSRLTPKQKRGLDLLDLAQSEAHDLEPDMRAFVLWQVSRGYLMIDTGKARSLLEAAFATALSIQSGQDECKHGEVELCGAKYWLEKGILQDLIAQPMQTGEIESLLAKAEPEVQPIVQPYLFRHYIHEGEFEWARQLLDQMADETQDFSYQSAAELMQALPPERSEERSELFSHAMEEYREHPSEKYPTFGDPAVMVLRFSQDVPPSLILGAIDQILDRAKDVKSDQPNGLVGISAKKGDIYFTSVYQFRLFQLMPVLERLDKSKAEILLQENNEVQRALEFYPQGLASIGALPGSNPQAGANHQPGIFDIGTFGRTEVGAEQESYETTRLESQILSEAEKDPGRALSDAMSLPLASGQEPEYGPRVGTLASLAWIAAKTDPAVSKAALEALCKIAETMQPRNQASTLSQVPQVYLRLGDEDGALNSLKDLIKVAGELYDLDSDVSDPNQAFKGMWPSTNLWQQCVAVAAKLGPSFAEQIIEAIPDPDIKAFATVTFANSLLGRGAPSLSIIEKHRGGIRASIMP